MTKKVLVTVWERDTNELASRLPEGGTLQTAIENRIICLTGLAATAMQNISSSNFKPDYHLVVAPEYLFMKTGASPYLDEDSKELIRARCKAFIDTNVTTILVPGTVLWAKSLIRPPTRATSRTGQLKQTPRNDASRLQKYQAASDQTLENLPSNERVYRGYRQRFFQQVGGWFDGQPHQTRRFARNSAFFITAHSVTTQHKRYENFVEELAEPDQNVDWTDTIFIPGGTSPIPDFGNMSFGLEICAEHDVGPTAFETAADLDFHIIVSASIPAQAKKSAARTGGFIVHADSKHSSVYKMTSGTTFQEQRCVHNFKVVDNGASAGSAKSFFCELA